MDIISSYGTILVVLAILFGLYMTWGIGANDLANAMGTSVGAGAITIKQAICIAIVFEFAGAVLAGYRVAARHGRRWPDGGIVGRAADGVDDVFAGDGRIAVLLA